MDQPELAIWRIYLYGQHLQQVTVPSGLSRREVLDMLSASGLSKVTVVRCMVDGTPVFYDARGRERPCLEHRYHWTETARLGDSLYQCIRCGTYHPNPKFPAQTVAAVRAIEELVMPGGSNWR